jgi:acyl-CoA synthetase (AMP-forming)/AMP-acid ligase II
VLGLDEVGEVQVRSPAAMTGYFRNPQATAEVLDAEGWLRTGDLGSLSSLGHLTLRGRAREVIMRGGVNIYPAEIENVLIQHPAVLAAAAVGVADERLGQQVAAVVVLRDGAEAPPPELEAFVRERIAHYKVPRVWRFVDRLPMTASGKVRKADLAALFTDAEA